LRLEGHTRAVVAAAVLAGCSGGPATDNPGGLVHAPDRVVDSANAVKAATDAAELEHAMRLPHTRIAEELGPHRFRGSSELRVSAGNEVVEQLGDETAIDFAGGDFRATLENSHDYGRHAVFVNGVLYLRPRYGKYHRRPPVDDAEPGRIRNEIFATFGDYFELVAPGVAPRDAGPLRYHGREARKVELTLADAPRARTERAAQRKWREDAVVNAVTGHVVPDAATGAPLGGELSAEVAFTRDGTAYTMALSANHAIEAVGELVEIAAPPPEQAVATPSRSHEIEERDQLLRGIAPPARKARMPRAGGANAEGGQNGAAE